MVTGNHFNGRELLGRREHCTTNIIQWRGDWATFNQLSIVVAGARRKQQAVWEVVGVSTMFITDTENVMRAAEQL